jgi:hypothetical protein
MRITAGSVAAGIWKSQSSATWDAQTTIPAT